ncbi:MAG TPA: hypothetical protein VFN18_12215 [Solirubrobacterales bacterium]|nr:hypothetical protein [Solirubrobacterales bacterium]
MGGAGALQGPDRLQLDLLGAEMLEEAAAFAEEDGGSKVPRPATTAPVAIASPSAPSGRPGTPPCSVGAPAKIHSCRRSPPSPRPLSTFSLGPATKPSSDIDM